MMMVMMVMMVQSCRHRLFNAVKREIWMIFYRGIFQEGVGGVNRGVQSISSRVSFEGTMGFSQPHPGSGKRP